MASPQWNISAKKERKKQATLVGSSECSPKYMSAFEDHVRA
jgi:hypothetical protein